MFYLEVLNKNFSRFVGFYLNISYVHMKADFKLL